MSNSQIIKKIDDIFREEPTNGYTIQLNNEDIQDAEFDYLLTKETSKVGYLYLCNSNLSCLSIIKMKQMNWNFLIELWLDGIKIGDRGSKYLARVAIPQINYIASNQISSFGVCHLAKAQWNNPQTVGLDWNRIGFGGLKGLAAAKWIKRLKLFCLRNNQLYVDELYRFILCEMAEGVWIWTELNKLGDNYENQLRLTLHSKHVSDDISL